MSMKLGINGGNMEITDNNETIVSSNIADELKEQFKDAIQPDDKQDWKQPELVVKD